MNTIQVYCKQMETIIAFQNREKPHGILCSFLHWSVGSPVYGTLCSGFERGEEADLPWDLSAPVTRTAPVCRAPPPGALPPNNLEKNP